MFDWKQMAEMNTGFSKYSESKSSMLGWNSFVNSNTSGFSAHRTVTPAFQRSPTQPLYPKERKIPSASRGSYKRKDGSGVTGTGNVLSTPFGSMGSIVL